MKVLLRAIGVVCGIDGAPGVEEENSNTGLDASVFLSALVDHFGGSEDLYERMALCAIHLPMSFGFV